MRIPVLIAALPLVLAGIAGAAEPSKVTTIEGVSADGTRFYEDSIVIDAPVKILWSAFTDTATYRTWAVPVASVDFRLGGVIEASYDPNGKLGDKQNIKNEFTAYLPEQLLVFRNVQAPDMLPGHEVYGQTAKIVEFETSGPSRTKVTVSGVGFGGGTGFDQLYKFFSVGDGEMLKTLKAKFESADAR